ncbi:glucosaminidase domain-containing protein [Shewanella submarina]|uniref:Glucosaminidase domain-containing protein n=1 Tax=Shewanella submarina TaxID=2016376 RepID=A0ABV7GDL6_9GAMM|nr:glucosaminidase domain-containing protein [Shewanella submarina]MCL1039237.1 glucosaminidase domain-containing protein [Shewanella submarina]
MKTGRIGKLVLAFALVIVSIYGLRVALLPVGKEISVNSAQLLKNPLPPEAPKLPDFSAIADVREKKQAFFDFLRPMIRAQNALIAKERDFLQTVNAHFSLDHTLSDAERYRIGEIAQKYQFNPRVIDGDAITELLRRVDTVPENMVLIQAANETGWGSSRFAREGLNFFGQWCFRKGCGLVPLSRTEGLSHEVAKFDTVEDSVAAYLRNLNSNGAYDMFRAIRADVRAQGKEPQAEELVWGLMSYSERKEAYIEELLQMLQHNKSFLIANN